MALWTALLAPSLALACGTLPTDVTAPTADVGELLGNGVIFRRGVGAEREPIEELVDVLGQPLVFDVDYPAYTSSVEILRPVDGWPQQGLFAAPGSPEPTVTISADRDWEPPAPVQWSGSTLQRDDCGEYRPSIRLHDGTDEAAVRLVWIDQEPASAPDHVLFPGEADVPVAAGVGHDLVVVSYDLAGNERYDEFSLVFAADGCGSSMAGAGSSLWALALLGLRRRQSDRMNS
jgi:hypothetical protein